MQPKPRLSRSTTTSFFPSMTEVADFVEQSGLRFAYHHHLGTAVETAEELDRFLSVTGESVGLTLDTGHAALGGIDPLSVIRSAPERIAHVHCKDVRRHVFDKLMSEGGSFLDGVLRGMFTVPGDGDLDFALVFQALSDVRYSGWVIVEAEQDPAIANPRTYAQLGLDTLRAEASLSGLKEAA